MFGNPLASLGLALEGSDPIKDALALDKQRARLRFVLIAAAAVCVFLVLRKKRG
jgi:hypothetical protein